MTRSFASILDECLAALSRGELLDDCLARYPAHAEDLRTHLLLARRLSQTPRHEPRATVQTASWQQFRARAEDMRLGRTPRMSINIGWMRPLTIAAALVLAVVVAGGGTVYAAQEALPDSPLYRVKLASEEVRLWFTFDDAGRAELLLDQSNERTDEITRMLHDGKPIRGNVLTALRNRNARAVRILEDQPEERELLARAREQSAAQEDLLLALWGDLSESARDEYAEAVATLHNAQLRTADLSGSVMPEDLAAGVMNITGMAEQMSEEVWLFGGVEVRLDARTLREMELEEGQAVNVIAARGANGRLLALNVTVTDRQQPEQQYVVSGVLEEVRDDKVVIAGQQIAITERTLLKLRLQRGRQVEIKVEEVSGEAVAASVEGPKSDPEEAAPALFVYEGTLEDEVSTEAVTNEWLVGGQRFLVTPRTEIDARAADLARHARVRVEAVVEGDQIVARRVMVLAADPEGDAISDPIGVEGVFEAGDKDIWTVSGVEVDAPPGVEPPQVGSLVTLEGHQEGGLLITEKLVAKFHPGGGGLAQVRGRIGRIEEDGTLQVGFARVEMGVQTVVSDPPRKGSRVFIWGSLGDEGPLQAIYVNILDPGPPAADGDSED